MLADPNVFLLVLIAMVILLPIVPAYLLFKYLDASADVTGPWQGMNLKLGGAFAGYFAVVLIALSAYQLMKPPKTGFEVWDVNGKITDSNDRDIGPVSLQDFSANPAWIDDPVAGSFHMYVFTRPGPGSSIQYPDITIKRGTNAVAHFSLDPKQAEPDGPQITMNRATHEVTIRSVPFQRIAAYNDKQPAIVVGEQPAAAGASK